MKSPLNLKWTVIALIGALVLLFHVSVWFLYAAIGVAALIVAYTQLAPQPAMRAPRPTFEDEINRSR